jgi:hypothetical protein
MAMLNVRYLLTDRADTGSTSVFSLGEVGSPILVASRAVGIPDGRLRGPGAHPAIEAAFRAAFPEVEPEHEQALREAFPAFWLIGQTAPDLGTARCRQILLRGALPARQLGPQPEATVLDHRVWRDRALVRIRVSAACFARLAYSYHSSLEVRIDGQPVPVLETADHFVAVGLSPGEHVIELVPRLSPLRRAFVAFAVAVLVALAAAWIHGRRRGRGDENSDSRTQELG